jgi:hypothetical protein
LERRAKAAIKGGAVGQWWMPIGSPVALRCSLDVIVFYLKQISSRSGEEKHYLVHHTDLGARSIPLQGRT